MGRYAVVSGSILVVFAEAFYLCHTLSTGVFAGVAAGIVVSSALFFAMTSGIGLALAIAEVLAIGFWLVAQAWVTSASPVIQVQDLMLHLTLAITVILLWLSARHLRKVFAENQSLLQEIRDLRKVDDQTGVLTQQEFGYRLQVMWAGLRRRSEPGFLVRLTPSSSLSHARATVVAALAEAAQRSIRTNFDLVTVAGDEVLVALQNTTEQGVEVVLERFHGIAADVMSETVVDKLTIQIMPFDLTVPDAETWLMRTANEHAQVLTTEQRAGITTV